MYSIQNLTNSTIKFQGVTIGAYMTVCVGQISDYITLSRLSNSGKIRYFNTPAPKTESKPVAAAPVVEEKKVETKVEKKVEEKVEEVKEEVIDSKEKETPVDSVTEETTVINKKKRSSKK